MAFIEYVTTILPQMMIGLGTTLKMYFASLIFVLPLGVIFAILKLMGPKPVKWLLNIYTWAWRGTPLLLQLFIVIYGFPIIGVNLPKFVAAAGVFCLNMSAYVTEIMRAAIGSVDKGQYEACRVLGLSYPQTMLRVIIPQSFRIALPPTCNEAINLIKDTALVSVINLMDVTRTAVNIANRDLRIVSYVIAFIIFLLLTSFMVKLFNWLEKKATAYD
ncbi:MAG: amino acid ABC transporter permease [Firmicutes bacterium]|nr:amino acid ABC transporter permease [Bacillota bacterium]